MRQRLSHGCAQFRSVEGTQPCANRKRCGPSMRHLLHGTLAAVPVESPTGRTTLAGLN
jgi:hypothetical protein